MEKIILSKLQNLTKEELNNIKAYDEILVNDFLISIPNEFNINKMLENISNNYSKKIKKGIFNYSLAVKGLLPVVENYAKNYYIKNFYSKDTKYTELLKINDRVIIAVNLLNDILLDIE